MRCGLSVRCRTLSGFPPGGFNNPGCAAARRPRASMFNAFGVNAVQSHFAFGVHGVQSHFAERASHRSGYRSNLIASIPSFPAHNSKPPQVKAAVDVDSLARAVGKHVGGDGGDVSVLFTLLTVSGCPLSQYDRSAVQTVSSAFAPPRRFINASSTTYRITPSISPPLASHRSSPTPERHRLGGESPYGVLGRHAWEDGHRLHTRDPNTAS